MRASTTGPIEQPGERQQDDRARGADQRVAPAALGGDREHDRHRLEQLERDRERGAGEREQERGQSRFSPQKAAYGLPL